MFLFAAMASVALASCTTDESVFEGAKSTAGKIEFAAANYATQTRGTHGQVSLANTDFKVYAWENGSTNIIMDSVKVKYKGSAWLPESGHDYYWPNNIDVDFTAVAPAAAVVNEVADVDRSSAATTITFEYDATNPNPTTTNLMYADYVTQKYGYAADSDNTNDNPQVALLFRHVMAKLKFVAHQVNPSPLPNGIDSYGIMVNSMTLSGVKDQGRLVVNNSYVNAAKGDDANTVWTTSQTSDFASWQIVSTNKSIETDDYESTTDCPNYYVMPQAVAVNINLNIVYTVTTRFNGGTSSVQEFVKDIKLSTIDAVQNWYTNKNITYTINISPIDLKPITFTAQEENWCNHVNGSTTFNGGN